MAMIHAILDGSSTMYWDNDALNMAGVCTTTDLDSQLHDDPRYFFNPKGKAMSVKALMGGVDVIKVTKEVFAANALPAASDVDKFIPVAANGKYGAVQSSAPASGAYFRVEGFGTFSCGMEEVPAVYLRCMANYH